MEKKWIFYGDSSESIRKTVSNEAKESGMDDGRLEVRFTIDQDFMKELSSRVGETRATEITRSALTLLDWASQETSQGRVILSAKPDGTEVHRLALPTLTKITK